MTLKLSKKKNAPQAKEADESAPLAAIGLDQKNRTTRTLVGWIMDGSPSMTGFTQVQLDSVGSMVTDLRATASTARSILMNIVQVGTLPQSTGFQEIAQFQVPTLQSTPSTPLHLALEQMTRDLTSICADIRSSGIERTESVVVITTDGNANGTTQEVFDKAVAEYQAVCKKWSVTSLVVGVGNQLNSELLKKLTNSIPPLQIQELNASKLMPFIQQIARQVSVSRPGQMQEIDLPNDLATLE